MAVKYVKDFDFPSSAGFHSGAKGYAKGGAVKAPTRTKSTMKREMTQSNKLSGNGALPRISDMDVNKQSGGAGKKLMPGYKAGGPIKAKDGVFVTKADRKVIANRQAGYDAENARIETEEARPINRLRKAFENTSADISQGFKTKIKKPLLRAVAKAGPRIEKTLSKIPNRKAKALGLGAGALGAAAAASLMGDDDEADMEMDDIPVPETRRTENLSAPVESEDVPVTVTKETKSVTAPVRKAASKPKVDYDKMSAMDAVIAYNKLHNKNFDKSTEQEIRDRFASPSEGGMKRGGKVSKYAGGGDATYGASMTSQERAKAKRGVDPYEDRTRGLGAMTDAEAEAASKGLREKYGKKEDKPVMHPGGRQRFLLNQTEKTPMKSGGASKAKVSQNMVALRATGAMNPSFGKKTPMKSGGKAEASKSDMQQDRALMARHNRLMHPDQKSKLKNGGKSVPSYSSKPLIKKSGGGGCNY
jgi:hypothetical protein